MTVLRRESRRSGPGLGVPRGEYRTVRSRDVDGRTGETEGKNLQDTITFTMTDIFRLLVGQCTASFLKCHQSAN